MPRFDSKTTVNDVTRQYPSTLALFRGLGIDTCCGGALTLAQAAEKADIALDLLYGAVRSTIAADEQPAA